MMEIRATVGVHTSHRVPKNNDEEQLQKEVDVIGFTTQVLLFRQLRLDNAQRSNAKGEKVSLSTPFGRTRDVRVSQSVPVEAGGQKQEMMPNGLIVQPADGAQAAHTARSDER